MVNLKHLYRSFFHAFRGLVLATHEHTFRILLIAVFLVMLLMLVFPLAGWQLVALVLVMMMVLVLEVLNTVFERMADLVEPKMHRYVKEIKDLMAAAVFLASFAALIIGIIIFTPTISGR